MARRIGFLKKLMHFLCFSGKAPARANGGKGGSDSALSAARMHITLSEQVLHYAEKNCRLAKQRYLFGDANDVELGDARESLFRAKFYFMQSLRELQGVLDELSAANCFRGTTEA